jgi:hypothetical protein
MSYSEAQDLYGAYCIYRESGQSEKYREYIEMFWPETFDNDVDERVQATEARYANGGKRLV